MCTTCGCSDGATFSLSPPQRVDAGSGNGAAGFHDLRPVAAASPAGAAIDAVQSQSQSTRHVALEAEILGKNDQLADANRAWLDRRGVLGLNLVSSPGAGKTTLLARTVRALQAEWPIAVIEGDQATELDAARIREAGSDCVQINTGTGCHLDASMIGQALARLDPSPGSLLLIENVGNLVCPALFALGEHAKVVVLSVTEGEDKPIKYPHMFRAASLMLINKSDLAPYVDFDLQRCVDLARQVNPRIEILTVSARTGEGMDAWYRWLQARRPPELSAAPAAAATRPAATA